MMHSEACNRCRTRPCGGRWRPASISAVPPAGVYFVKFSLMAWMAGLLDVVRRREIGFARAEIDDVDSFAPKLVGIGHDLHGGGNADGRDAIRDVLLSWLVSCLFLLLSEALAQPLLNRRRNQPGDIAAQTDHFLHQFRTDEGELLAGQQENGFQLAAAGGGSSAPSAVRIRNPRSRGCRAESRARLCSAHSRPAARRRNRPRHSCKAPRTSVSICMRSSTLKSGAFASFRRIATISRSQSREPRSITSRWPLVIGSNDPG